VRIPLTTEQQLQRLLAQYTDDSVPDLLARALTALERQASEAEAAQ
jgi:hypothetical protein